MSLHSRFHRAILILVLVFSLFILYSSSVGSELSSEPGTALSENPGMSGEGQNNSSFALSAEIGSPEPAGGEDFNRPLMHFSSRELREYMDLLAQKPLAASYEGEPLPKSNHSYLWAVPYIGKDRDQGWCGNCWVWASTGALEVAHTVNHNISDRLSVQYFNSNWHNGTAAGNACDGGWPYQVAEFYTNTLKKTIPWSNTNASYADYKWESGNTSGIPASFIATSPAYPVEWVTDSKLNTFSGQETAINNIKAELNNNNPVVYSFFLPKKGWGDFYSFWKNQPESVVWNPDPYADTEIWGGHAVLIVGYNDTGSTPYWEILNSWGVNTNRTSGLFRLTMDLNYSMNMTENGTVSYANIFDVFNTSYLPPDKKTGLLSVTSYPVGGAILIDGMKTGYMTPETISGIPEGVHTLKLEKKGYVSYPRLYTIFPDKTTNVSVTLIPRGSAGSLFIYSTPPGAGIVLDGMSTGYLTPKTMVGILPGQHTVTLRKNGFHDWSQDTTVIPGTKTTIYGDLSI